MNAFFRLLLITLISTSSHAGIFDNTADLERVKNEHTSFHAKQSKQAITFFDSITRLLSTSKHSSWKAQCETFQQTSPAIASRFCNLVTEEHSRITTFLNQGETLFSSYDDAITALNGAVSRCNNSSSCISSVHQERIPLLYPYETKSVQYLKTTSFFLSDTKELTNRVRQLAATTKQLLKNESVASRVVDESNINITQVTNTSHALNSKDIVETKLDSKTGSEKPKEPIQFPEINEDLQATLLLIGLLLFLGILIAGMTNKIVIFYDGMDFIITFMTWGSLIIGYIAIDLFQHEGALNFDSLSTTQSALFYLSILSSASFLLWSIKLSIKHNRNIALGLLVGLFRLTTSLLGILVLVGQVGKVLDGKSSYRQLWVAVLIFFVFMWLGKKLINGEEVYAEKDWELPT